MIKPVRKIFSFLKETRAELGKVDWPTRRRTVRLTTVVIVVAIAFGVFIGVVDFGLSRGVEAVIDASEDKPAGGDSNQIQVPVGGGSNTIQIPAGGTDQNQSQPQPQGQ